MKSTTSLLVTVLMLFSITLSSSCASLALPSAPPLEERTLRLNAEFPGFEYSYFVCDKTFLGVCTRKKRVTDFYDISTKEMRRKLIDMGFVLKVREKP